IRVDNSRKRPQNKGCSHFASGVLLMPRLEPRRFLALFAFALFLIAPAWSLGDEPARSAVRVAVYEGAGTSKSLKELVKALQTDANLLVTRVQAEDIRSGKLSGFDVLVHPGGSGSKQGLALEEQGRQKVQDFVKNGGGYVG